MVTDDAPPLPARRGRFFSRHARRAAPGAAARGGRRAVCGVASSVTINYLFVTLKIKFDGNVTFKRSL